MCLSCCLVAPFTLARFAALIMTWVWAAVSLLAITISPALSQCGLALWIVIKIFGIVGQGSLLNCECTICVSHFASSRLLDISYV